MPTVTSLISRLLVALLLCISIVSCQKKEDDPAAPAPASATVDGTLTPAGSISRVTLSEPGLIFGQDAAPDVNGYFRFPSVKAGTYNVSFTASAGYLAPAPRTVTVAAGGTASVGTIVVNTTAPSNAALRGTVSWSVGGKTQSTTTVLGSVTLTNGTATSLSVLATAQTGNEANIVGLQLPYFGGTGLYRLENVMLSGYATYVPTTGGVPNGSFTTKGYTGLPGTITVTSYDAAARTISGTFGYTAYDQYGSAFLGTDRITISNGSFSLSY